MRLARAGASKRSAPSPHLWDPGDRIACRKPGSGHACERSPPPPEARCARRFRADATLSRVQGPGGLRGVFQPDGGWLALEPAFQAWISLAAQAGAGFEPARRSPSSNAATRCAYRAMRSRRGRRRIVTAGADERAVPGSSARDPPGDGTVRGPRILRGRSLAGIHAGSRHGTHCGIPPERMLRPGSDRQASPPRRAVDPTITPNGLARGQACSRRSCRPHSVGEWPSPPAKTCLYTADPMAIYRRSRTRRRASLSPPYSGHGFLLRDRRFWRACDGQ
jgi:hypothetical protein